MSGQRGAIMKTKKELLLRFRQILHSFSIGEPINDLEHIFIEGQLRMHPNADQKFGCGIDYFFVKENKYNNKAFYIKRIDGSETDFSFYSCIYPTSKLQDIKKACRFAIKSQIDAERTRPDTHIHHANISFDDLFKTWMADKSIDDIELIEHKDGTEHEQFKNPVLEEDWKLFHLKRADLIEVTKDEHKALHKKAVK